MGVLRFEVKCLSIIYSMKKRGNSIQIRPLMFQKSRFITSNLKFTRNSKVWGYEPLFFGTFRVFYGSNWVIKLIFPISFGRNFNVSIQSKSQPPAVLENPQFIFNYKTLFSASFYISNLSKWIDTKKRVLVEFLSCFFLAVSVLSYLIASRCYKNVRG
jgi:hypothetical protein